MTLEEKGVAHALTGQRRESTFEMRIIIFRSTKERVQNNFHIYASQLQGTYARYQIPKISK